MRPILRWRMHIATSCINRCYALWPRQIEASRHPPVKFAVTTKVGLLSQRSRQRSSVLQPWPLDLAPLYNPPPPSPLLCGRGSRWFAKFFADGDVFPPARGGGGARGGLPQQKPSHRKQTDYLSSYNSPLITRIRMKTSRKGAKAAKAPLPLFPFVPWRLCVRYIFKADFNRPELAVCPQSSC